MQIKTRKIVLAFFIILFSTCLIMTNSKSNKSGSIRVWNSFRANSADPLDYDLAVHHIMMRSVMASLVSVYKKGEIEPQIGKSWSSNSSKTSWEILIDKEWTFDNGEKVTAQIVEQSFKRVILIKNKLNSKSGFLEFLIDSEKLNSLSGKIAGIQVKNDSIIFNFVKPMPDFLEKVSFGLYSIAHPNDYDSEGNWKDKQKANFSGSYRISKWNEKDFELELRENLKRNLINHENRIKKITFDFSDEPDLNSLDLLIREKYSPYMEDADWTYSSTRLDNNITYIKVMKWDVKDSAYSQREFRTKLRNLYYEELQKAGLEVTKSFFPLAISGIKEFDYQKVLALNLEQKILSTQPFFFSSKKNFKKKELGRIYDEAFQGLANRINAKALNVDYPEKEEDEKKLFDIQFLGTGILIDDPSDDIRFMFLSKHGIKLPDETGEILEELKKEKLDFQKINKLIWEQSIIWPVRHYSKGFWINNKSEINVDEMNLTLHPIDFQFLRINL